jgi:periplasmic divalent cation tolerance protein
MSDPVWLALTTCPDEASAQAIATALVQERLATCVNRIGGVRSTYLWSKAAEALSTTPAEGAASADYFWDARLQDEAEVLLIIKTTAGRLDELRTRLSALHPYHLPELLAIEVVGGNERYLDWVRMGVRRKGE